MTVPFALLGWCALAVVVLFLYNVVKLIVGTFVDVLGGEYAYHCDQEH